MRKAELEAWVLSVLDTLSRGTLPEDSRVELKADWPEPHKAARRIAGHANASFGDDVLWIIGVDEKKGVVPFATTDLATWFPQVQSHFDGVAPDLQDLVIPTANGAVVALLFSTDRAPYVIRTPSAGQADREVPWRDGTRIRSATRSDLVRLLVPVGRLPEMEVLAAQVSLYDHPGLGPKALDRHPEERGPHLRWQVNLNLYVTPGTSELLVLPVHRSDLKVLVNGTERCAAVRYYVPFVHAGLGDLRADSHTIRRTEAEALVEGPGVLTISGSLVEPGAACTVVQHIDLSFSVRPTRSSLVARIVAHLELTHPANVEEHVVGVWQLPEAVGTTL